MTSAEQGGVRPPPTDPMKGIRGIFAATLILESIVVLLALLVLPKFGEGATAAGVTTMVVIALAMIVASGLQRRPRGLQIALALQVVTIVAGFWLVTALGIMGLVFALVWAILLWMRYDVGKRMAEGRLPSQQDSG
ncbi:DUF4233 domain-containing protein [Pseudonocardia endophytica]|uniref:Uncharacterized protein DUF4233 n=1 Tax=Pseudonocardia endophytica TaxID=401976 RepID=A0A4R1HFV8_PSEEN|nr:DUF4233 domain-containing protein [Pseudonocardia endophytica]TCK21034.1 uncharacterized protein DUF4233 [Pseudonocardia endophytica]